MKIPNISATTSPRPLPLPLSTQTDPPDSYERRAWTWSQQGKKIGSLLGAAAMSIATPIGLGLAGISLGAPVVTALALSPVGLITGQLVASYEEHYLGIGKRSFGLVGGLAGRVADSILPPKTEQPSGPVRLEQRAPTGRAPRRPLLQAITHRVFPELSNTEYRTRSLELGENLGATLLTMAAGYVVPRVVSGAVGGPAALAMGTVLGPLLGILVGGIEENALGIGRGLGELVGAGVAHLRGERQAEQPLDIPPPEPGQTPPLVKGLTKVGQVIAEPLITSLIDAAHLSNRLFAQTPYQTVQFENRELPEIDSTRVLNNFVRLAGISATSGKETPITEELKAQLDRLGIQFEEKANGNLIATVPGTQVDAPTVVLSAHQDTVGPTSSEAIIVGEHRVFTDGSHILGADNRAGIAQILEAVQTVKESGQEHPELKLVFTVSEETGLHGAASLQPEEISERPALGIVVDSTKVENVNLTNDAVIVNGRSVKYQYSQEEPVVQLAFEGLSQAGIRPRPVSAPIMVGAGTDANTLAFNSGPIRSIAIGCGQTDIHSPLENIARRDLERVSQALVGMIIQASDFEVSGDQVVPKQVHS